MFGSKPSTPGKSTEYDIQTGSGGCSVKLHSQDTLQKTKEEEIAEQVWEEVSNSEKIEQLSSGSELISLDDFKEKPETPPHIREQRLDELNKPIFSRFNKKREIKEKAKT